MRLSFLNRYGWCITCNTWSKMENGKSSLSKHNNENGEACPNSGYSAWEIKYEVENIEAAKKLAAIINEDKGGCLNGGRLHSMACGDGEECSATRAVLAKALAEFVLNKM